MSDISSTSQQSEEVKMNNEVCENQLDNGNICNNCTNINEDINDTKPLLSLSPISTINSSINNNSNEISFNPKEWFITDSISGKLRPPRQIEYLLLLLENPNYSSYVTWSDKNQGTFIIHEPIQVAALWRKVKNRQTIGNMDYDKFARGLRFYYKSGLMIKTHKKRTFRFKLPINTIS